MKHNIRTIFIPNKENLFLAFDFSQAETWVSAFLSRDDNMKYNLINKDIHTATAAFIFNIKEEEITKGSKQRYIGKKCNHGLTYRMSAYKFAESINLEGDKTGVFVTVEETETFIRKWLTLYARIPNWWAEIDYEISKYRKLTTPYGRVRTFFGDYNNDLLKEATAYVPQSTVSDHTFGAIQKELGIPGGILAIRKFIISKNIPAKIVHTAYDSVMLEVEKSAVDDVAGECYKLLYRPIIINGEECTIPCEAEVGERWGELEKYAIRGK